MATPGQPSSYKPEYNELAHYYCLLGAANEVLGDFFAVAPRTIDNWITSRLGFVNDINHLDVHCGSRLAPFNAAETVRSLLSHPRDALSVRSRLNMPIACGTCGNWFPPAPPVRSLRLDAGDLHVLRPLGALLAVLRAALFEPRRRPGGRGLASLRLPI